MTDKEKQEWFVKNQYRPSFTTLQEIFRMTLGKNFTPECVNNCYHKAVDIVNIRNNTECINDVPYGKGYIEVRYITCILLEMCADLAMEE